MTGFWRSDTVTCENTGITEIQVYIGRYVSRVVHYTLLRTVVGPLSLQNIVNNFSSIFLFLSNTSVILQCIIVTSRDSFAYRLKQYFENQTHYFKLDQKEWGKENFNFVLKTQHLIKSDLQKYF